MSMFLHLGGLVWACNVVSFVIAVGMVRAYNVASSSRVITLSRV